MTAKGDTNVWGKIIARAWQDDAFKAHLKAHPAAVLREHGIDIPGSVQIRVLEDTDGVVHLTLPARPSEREIPEEDLDKVVAGALNPGLVSTLSQYFGWSAGQVNRIIDADQVPSAPRSPSTPPKTDRSPPTMG